MSIVISGSSGLIGRALVGRLVELEQPIRRMVRKPVAQAPAGEGDIHWLPLQETVQRQKLEGTDALVHLAGQNVAEGKWTKEQKEGIRKSRVKATRTLCEALAKVSDPPKVLVAASAVGFYGDRGDEVLTEDSPAGDGFLPEVATEWEKATEPARQAGIRVVNLRFGMVLSPNGGALSRMVPMFRRGLGGPLGSGRQFVSWVAIDDAVGSIVHAIRTESLSGPVNVTAPNPVTNREFVKTLGHVLGKGAWLPAPGFALKMLYGQMAEELLLASCYAVPKKLTESGYKFQYPELEPALRHVLKIPAPKGKKRGAPAEASSA
jgi:uncharacterized protein (TIGR01777 family)